MVRKPKSLQAGVAEIEIGQPLAQDVPEPADPPLQQAQQRSPEVVLASPHWLVLVQDRDLPHARRGGHAGRGPENLDHAPGSGGIELLVSKAELLLERLATQLSLEGHCRPGNVLDGTDFRGAEGQPGAGDIGVELLHQGQFGFAALPPDLGYRAVAEVVDDPFDAGSKRCHGCVAAAAEDLQPFRRVVLQELRHLGRP